MSMSVSGPQLVIITSWILLFALYFLLLSLFPKCCQPELNCFTFLSCQHFKIYSEIIQNAPPSPVQFGK